MAEPSKKSPGVTHLLESKFGRTTAIKSDSCVRPPMGCGKPIRYEVSTRVRAFKDDLSLHEYTISGLCQDCQDQVFT